MSEKARITAVLIDTSSYRKANCDFIGINSKTLPSFFDAIEQKELLLLTHPILNKEVEKHIEESGLCQDYKNLISQVHKSKNVLKSLGHNEDVIEEIISYDLKSAVVSEYNEIMKKAVNLDYPDPSIVFDLYFSAKPPFAEIGKKKHEFPDAFVIESAKEYIEEHYNDVLLVVSNDNDWENAFKDIENVIVCKSIDDAITMINNIECILSQEMLDDIFKAVYEDLILKAQKDAEFEAYELEEYEFTEDLEIDSVEVIDIDDGFIPLKISRDSILIKATARLKVAGHGEVLDEDNSIWDSEDREYIYVSYADLDFENGYAEVECEIEIGFDFDCPEGSAEVISFKLNNRWNISVECDSVNLTTVDEHELALRCLREDKGYTRRFK